MAHEHQIAPTEDETEDLETGEEVWRRCPTYPDYEVSESGRVLRWSSGDEPVEIEIPPSGVRSFKHKKGHRRKIRLAQLVADGFLIPDPGRDHYVWHLDGDASNNHYTNLYWRSFSDRMKEFAGTPNHVSQKTHCKWGHEFTEANTRIDHNGARVCRKCSNAHAQLGQFKRAAKYLGQPHEHMTLGWWFAGRPKVESTSQN